MMLVRWIRLLLILEVTAEFAAAAAAAAADFLAEYGNILVEMDSNKSCFPASIRSFSFDTPLGTLHWFHRKPSLELAGEEESAAAAASR